MSITFTRRHQRDDLLVYDFNIERDPFVVTVTASPSVVHRWVTSIVQLYKHIINDGIAVVGLGVQFSASPNTRYTVDTMQLCIGEQCLIFQLSRAPNAPRVLRDFLQNKGCTFVGFWNCLDRRMLGLSRHRLRMRRNPVDVRSILGNKVGNASMESIVERSLGYFGISMSWNVIMSNWNGSTLTDDQVVQASVEPRCAFLIGAFYGAWLR
ncbi:uncharacterized protein LOC113852235 [Abrus precatorius]|uniref:Uncharacterized protein LOC113852235 n=1 Tax=Abrus precatorius TaxID=3816 RepID=A0A8B8K4M9_ABRPR|nr:uncharacterized protein LOC113852235 [Abrus precatorius]